MNLFDDLPDDFREAVRFHGHLCPGLAIGYVAAKVAAQVIGIGTSEDEEIVAVVENNSCAVDAIQVLLGCTFGKGNLIFKDWGKQVFTLMDRRTNRAVRVSFTGPMPERDERRALKVRIDSGKATDSGKGKVGGVEAERNQADSLGRSPRLLPDPGNCRRTASTCRSGCHNAVRTLRRGNRDRAHAGNGWPPCVS